jgi:hypothetical protein
VSSAVLSLLSLLAWGFIVFHMLARLSLPARIIGWICALIVGAWSLAQAFEYFYDKYMLHGPGLHAAAHSWWKASPYLSTLSVASAAALIVGAVAAFGFWVWANEPAEPSNPPAATTPQETKHKTLHDLYASDFPHFARDNNSWKAHSQDGKLLGGLESKVWFDTKSNSQFISVFIPHSPHTAEICASLVPNHKDILEDAKGGLYFLETNPGETLERDSRKLVFTGQIYVYHEASMSLAQMAQLEKVFVDNKLSLQLRGPEYLSVHYIRAATERKKD